MSYSELLAIAIPVCLSLYVIYNWFTFKDE